jgi:hypothetical protein
MSILARFQPANLTSELYEDVNRRLDDAGLNPPDGRELHVCFGDEGQLRVSEVWESREKMDAFGEKLMPILGEAGVKLGTPPEVMPVVSIERP